MTVGEVFSKISAHQIKGMMAHEQLSNYFDFLGLKGYKRCQEYHYIEETISHRGINRYYINHHGKLIEPMNVENPNIIPASWYKYSRVDVDINTKKNAVKNAFDIWCEWEKETKEFYEECYVDLLNMNEVSDAYKINSLLTDVDCELKLIERKILDLKAIDYDLSIIVPEQQELHDKYKEKIEDIDYKYAG